MKTLLPIFLIIIVAACAGTTASVADPFPSSGVDAADSLFGKILRMSARMEYSRRDINRMSDSFCVLAAKHPRNRMLRLRSIYVAGCTLAARNETAAVAGLLSKELCRSDSSSYPYEWHLLRTLGIRTERSLYTKYVQASENVAYFTAMGSDTWRAANCELLGDILNELGDIKRSAEYYDKAAELYDRCGATRNKFLVELSKSAVPPANKDPRVFRRLLADTTVHSDPVLRSRVLQNSYLVLDSAELLDKAIAVLEKEKVDRGAMPVLLSMKAYEFLGNGSVDSAYILLERIKVETQRTNPPAREQQFIHAAIAYVYQTVGMNDSAVEHLCQVVKWNEYSYSEANLPAIYTSETAKLIDAESRNAKLRRERIVMWWVISLLGILILVGYILYIYRKRAVRRAFEIKLLEDKINGAYRTGLAQSTVLKENRNLISDIKSAVDAARTGNKDSELVSDLRKLISLHESKENSRQGFLKVSRELDGYFVTELKKDFPNLSESQLRLAALIAAGVDSHQLSDILNITSKSLYTSRYRLRSCLGLAKEDSLEDFLRRYAGSGTNQQDSSVAD